MASNTARRFEVGLTETASCLYACMMNCDAAFRGPHDEPLRIQVRDLTHSAPLCKGIDPFTRIRSSHVPVALDLKRCRELHSCLQDLIICVVGEKKAEKYSV